MPSWWCLTKRQDSLGLHPLGQGSRVWWLKYFLLQLLHDAARDGIPEELRLGLILTIYEAKGLEFDDVLLYNFFKDSQVAEFLP